MASENGPIKSGPFQIIDNGQEANADTPAVPPARRYECPNYETCLNIACALNWDSFGCADCDGTYEQSLFWRARQAVKKDRVASSLCNLPRIHYLGEENPFRLLKKRAVR